MKNLNEYITEGKDEKFFNSIKSLLSKDEVCNLVINRTQYYDDNKSKSSQVPKVLIKEETGYQWYTLDMVDEQLDIAAPKDIVGLYVNRMFYPLSNKELLLDIVNKYNEE